MRLTIINQFYRPDLAPTATLAASLAEHRAAMGDQVTIIAGKGGYTGGSAAADEAAPGANPRVRRVWTPGLGKATNLKRVIDYAAFYLFAAWRLLTLPRQDVIISLTTPPLIPWTARLHKWLHPSTRLILWNMDCYPDVAERSGVIRPDGLIARLCRAFNRSIFRELDHLVCLDTAMAELLCAQYAPCQPDLPVTIIPNWEEARFFPSEAGRPIGAGAPREWPDRLVILYLGNMGYGHAFETVLDAATQLRDEAVFLFIGGGRRASEIVAEAARRGLQHVVVRGYVPKERTREVMAAADCALVTLRDDALGIMSPSKIHANLAMGLPLIYVGPERSNVDEAIRTHGCGVSLRHGDSAGLVAFVRRLRDPAERQRLRSVARAAFERAYCDVVTLPRFDAVIAHVVAGAAARAPMAVGRAAWYAQGPPGERNRDVGARAAEETTMGASNEDGRCQLTR